MTSQFDHTGPQTGSKGCHNCAHRDSTWWDPNGPCRPCTGYHGGYPEWKADDKTLAGYIKAIQREEKVVKVDPECHLGDSKLNVTPVPSTEYDIVSKPKHYMLFDEDEINATAYLREGIEVRDVIEKLVAKISVYPLKVEKVALFTSDYVQMMQYLMRFMDKNGKQDLEKAKWYLEKMLEAYPEEN